MQDLRTGFAFLPPKVPFCRVSSHMHEGHEQDSFDELKEKGHPSWATDRIELRSVGIDIGSSTSHLMFSHLILKRMGKKLSSKFVVVNREILWKSEIILTPYIGRYQIDIDRLSAFLDQSYCAAGMSPDRVDTGAVIITGEASRNQSG